MKKLTTLIIFYLISLTLFFIFIGACNYTLDELSVVMEKDAPLWVQIILFIGCIFLSVLISVRLIDKN